MEASNLPMSVSPEQEHYFWLKYPRAYFQECRGLRSGIVRYQEIRLIDPDQNYKCLGKGKDELEAIKDALEGQGQRDDEGGFAC